MSTMQVSNEPHSAVSEHMQDYAWSDISEEMLTGHQETARTITFRGTPDEVEAAIHSAQVALIRHRSQAVRQGRITNYIYAVMKRGTKLMVFNRPVGDYHKYIHRAPADVFTALADIAAHRRYDPATDTVAIRNNDWPA